MKKTAATATSAMAFSVAMVLFSAHAGGGFATGNQANTYFVGLGWWGPIVSVLAMLMITLTMREAMIMYNSRQLSNYKELFETLFHPFDKIEIFFEIFFYIMVLMAIAAAISGAATALSNYFGLNYYLGVAIVGIIVFFFTIFGADLVRKASTYMGIAILFTAIVIYIIGIFKSPVSVGSVMKADFAANGFSQGSRAFVTIFQYAGFPCVTLPTMLACGTVLDSKKSCEKSMWMSFGMNAVALALSVLMLMSWSGVYTNVENGTSIPTLTCCQQMGITALTVIYAVCLLTCLVSTGVTTTFGFVVRFEKLKAFANIKSATVRSAIVSAFIIILSMAISLLGLTFVIKYGYGYCGYLGIFVIVVPFVTIGYYKNRKFMKENGEVFEIPNN